MANFKIPQDGNRKVIQPNDGKVAGNVYSTFGMDFNSSPGKINVSPRLYPVTSSNSSDSSNISGLGYPVSIKFVFGRWRVLGGTDAGSGKIYINDGTPTGVYSADTATSSPTNVDAKLSDSVVFNSIYYVANPSSNIMKQTSDGGAFASAGGTTSATYFNFLKDGGNLRLYYISQATGRISYMTTGESHVTSGNGTIGFTQSPTCATVTENRMWIGTVANYYGEGTVIEWDMSDSSQQANAIHSIGATAVMAACTANGTPYILCSDATLKMYSGGGFVKVAQFPSYISDALIDFYTYPFSYSISNFIHPNGMTLVNGKIQFLIKALKKTTSKNNLFPEMGSGIWEFDPNEPSLGIYHKSPVTISSDGLSDAGQFVIERPCALVETKQPLGSIIAGAGYYSDATTTQTAIFTDDLSGTFKKNGFLTTPELFTGNPVESWHEGFILHEYFKNSTDKIISKYKYTQKANFPFVAVITWTSTTTFTSTDTDFQYVTGGEEVLVTQGKGGNYSAHVSSISSNAGTYTVTIDDTIGFTSGTAKVLVDNWTRIGVSSSQNQDSSEIPMTGIEKSKNQFRFEIRGQGASPEINQFIVNSSKQK